MDKNKQELEDELNDEFDPSQIFDDTEERRDFGNDDDKLDNDIFINPDK